MKHTVIALFDRDAQARDAAAALAAAGFGRAAIHVGDDAAADAAGTPAGTPASTLAEAENHPHLSPASVIEGGTGVRGRLMDFFSNLFGVEDTPHGAHYEEAVRRGGSVVSVDADDEDEAARARDALIAAGAVNLDDRVESWREGGWTDQTDATRSAAPSWTGVHRHEVSVGGVRVYGRTADAAGFDTDAYRADHMQRYAASGPYEDYEPAYRYGHALRSDERWRGRDWDAIEPEVRSDWEQRHPGSAWERFKGSVRHAWDRATS